MWQAAMVLIVLHNHELHVITHDRVWLLPWYVYDDVGLGFNLNVIYTAENILAKRKYFESAQMNLVFPITRLQPTKYH